MASSARPRQSARLILLLALVLLHGKDGHPAWIVPAQVVSVEPNHESPGANTLIKTLSGDRYVAESAEDVVRALQAAGCKE
jgi:hypothetical protein